MADSHNLRRTKSLKSLVSKKWSKREMAEEQQPLPPIKALNHSFVQLHISSNEMVKRRVAPPSWTPSQRHTWPVSLKERQPGSYIFDTTPTLTRTPWEYERSRRPASQWSRNSSDRSTLPPGMFEQLPGEILHCILDQLEVAHCTELCLDVQNLQHDLRSLCMSTKQWLGVAREQLYRNLWTPSQEVVKQNNIMPIRRPLSRLQLLLRTLVEAPAVADIVRCIRITQDLASEIEWNVKHGRLTQHKRFAVDVLSDVILKCRNLEHLTGYAPMALGRASGLFAALACCSNLKSHIWRLPQAPSDSERMLHAGDFVSDWQQLETLVLWQPSHGHDILPGTVSATIQRLPSLKHLVMRGLHPTDFHNGTLLMLPALQSLRLEDVHGITDQGIEQLAHSRPAFSLRKLTLYGLELTSLRTIQILLSSLPRLESFTLLQDTSPEVPPLCSVTGNNFLLESNPLNYLHWNVIAQGYSTAILANSIAAGRFPSLRTVKVPCDYEGAIQSLCRPIPFRPIIDVDLRTVEDWESSPRYVRSLQVSKIQAQLRVHKSRRKPSFEVVVQDEDEAVQHKHVIGSYLGDMASKIEYSLEPAIGGTEDAIAELAVVSMPSKASLHQRRDGVEQQMLDLSVLF